MKRSSEAAHLRDERAETKCQVLLADGQRGAAKRAEDVPGDEEIGGAASPSTNRSRSPSPNSHATSCCTESTCYKAVAVARAAVAGAAADVTVSTTEL